MFHLKKEHAIGTFCNETNSRYSLSDTYVHLAEAYIEAIDGKIMIRIPITGEAPLRLSGTKNARFNGKKLDKAIAFTKKHKEVNREGALLGCHNKDGKLAIQARDKDIANDPLTVQESIIDGKWPNCGDILNSHAKDKPVLEVRLNAVLLKTLATYAVKAAATPIEPPYTTASLPSLYPAITFKFYDNDGNDRVHFEIETESGMAKGVLMPMNKN